MDSRNLSLQIYVLFVSAIVVLSTVLCSASTNCKFPAIFNFGDSNSDTGGLSAAFGQVPPPYGITFFHAPAGRYSDGRLIIDFMAESLGLPYLSAFLDSVGSNFSHGANFATAASTIRPQNGSLSQTGYSPFSLDVQFTQFSDFHRRSQMIKKRGGVFQQLLPEESDFSRALYMIDIGQNDFTAGYDLNLSTEQVNATVPDLVQQISNVIQLIYANGGRSFWIHNTGPVGCLPYVMVGLRITAAQVDDYGCASPINEIAQYFNRRLKETVIELRKNLSSAAITYVDIYSVKYTLITQAKKLGFHDPFLVCCGYGGGKFNYDRNLRCGDKQIVNGTEIIAARSCKDPSSSVSWDGIHFTEAANKWIYEQIVKGSFSDPPIPLNLACNRRDP